MTNTPTKKRKRASSPKNIAPVKQHGCTLQQYADAKKLPVTFLQSLGLREVSDGSSSAARVLRIPYIEDGKEIAVRLRIALSSKDRFRWRKGSKPILYANVSLITPGVSVILVEGESDCHTLWHHGICAYGLPGASGWKEEYAVILGQHDLIYVLIEPDTGGETVLKWLAHSRIRHKAKLVTLDGFKDPSAMHCDDPKKFRERWQHALATAMPYAEHEAAAKEKTYSEAWKQCAAIAQLPDILGHFATVLKSQGMVGQEREAKLIFLVLVSRVFPRPISGKVQGPSSGGKSFLLECVIQFFPAHAYYWLTAMSDKNLAYTDEPLSNRILLIAEAAALQSDMGSYLIRTLLSEGKIAYEFVEKTAQGMRSRKVEKEGPTGFITTTTAASLHPENETRLLTLSVTDTREQTQAILESLATEIREAIDYAPWHTLQDWLETGECRVVIPFAPTLAANIPPVALRLRRDFTHVLTLIKAHALLHRASHKHDNEGRIIATLDDYSVVRELVHDLIATQAEVTVSKTVRETVKAVEAIIAEKISKSQPSHASNTDIMARLRLDRSPVSNRVNKAINLGYLNNEETRKGRPAQLVTGNPMPDDAPILPAVETLKDLLRCSGVDKGDNTPPSPSTEEEIVL